MTAKLTFYHSIYLVDTLS